MVARVKLAAAEPDNPKYAIKPEEQVAIQKQLFRMKQNTAPGLKITSGRTAVDHPDRLVGELMLREALATSDSDFLHGIMSQLAGAASSEGCQRATAS